MVSINVSVVIPVYSGAPYLRELVRQLEIVRASWRDRDSPMRLSEVIFVDDSAIDASPELLSQLTRDHSWISVIILGRNFGQHAATMAGISRSSGDWIVTMDEDLQHPPEAIQRLFREAAMHSRDVVYGTPVVATHGHPMRDLTSRSYKRFILWISDYPYVREISSFRLIRGSVARGASKVCGHDTYFDLALTWFTGRFSSVPLPLKDHRFATTGKSGYSLRSLFSHARRLLVSSNLRVLRFGALVGFALTLFCMTASISLGVAKLLNPDLIAIQGWTSLMLATVGFSGVIMMLLGITIEYLSILVQKAHGRPVFFLVDRSADCRLADYFGVTPPSGT